MVQAQRPRRGDIYHLNFTPSVGKEIVGKHFAFIISPEGYNTRGLVYVAPITTGGNLARSEGLAVSLTGAGTKTTGVIDLTKIRAVDLAARSGTFVEKAPTNINDEVFAGSIRFSRTMNNGPLISRGRPYNCGHSYSRTDFGSVVN